MTSSKEETKKEVKKINILMYTVVVSLDGQMEESFAVEGSSVEDAFKRLLGWYLIFRSKKFPNLGREDIEPVEKSTRQLEQAPDDFIVGSYEATIPVKNDTKEVVGQRTLKGTFSKATYGMLL